MPSELAVADFQVKVDGSAIADDLMQNIALVRVEESMHLPSTFAIRFFDEDFALYDKQTFAVGKPVEIAFGWGSSLTTVMRGEVTAVQLEARSSGVNELTVVGLDKMHRAMRGTKTQTFQNQSDADIARKVASAAGLTADVDATGSPYPYLFQINESDHLFLRNRARRIGFDFWVSEGKLHFKKAALPSSSVTATWGEDLYRFKARMSAAGLADEVQVRGWDDATQKAIVGKATANPADPSDATFYTGHLSDAKSKFGQATRITGRFAVGDQTEADTLAGSLRERLSTAGLLVRGEMDGNPAVGAGTTLKLAGLGTRASGSYLLTSVEHVYGADQPYVTRFVSSGPEAVGLPDLLAGVVDASGQPRSGTTLMVGVVTNLNDPDSAGRVRVKLPTISDSDESFWARVALPGAGGTRGLQSLPSVNDEVVVAFEQGDPRRAFVLGGLWSKKNKPPESTFQADGTVNKQLWRSGKGHEIKIDDADDGTIALTVKGIKSKLEITKSDTHLEGDSKVSVKGSDIEITASGKLTLKGSQVEINGSSDVTVKGGVIKLN